MRDVNVPKDWPIHMHCFTNTWQFCEEWAKEWTSMMFGFTPDSFSEQVIVNLPLSRILLETDAPYFLPKQVIILFMHGLLNRLTDIFILPRPAWGLTFNINNGTETHSIFVKL